MARSNERPSPGQTQNSRAIEGQTEAFIQEIQTLKNQIKELNTSKNELTSKLNNAQALLVQSDQELNVAQMQIQALQEEIRQLKSKNDQQARQSESKGTSDFYQEPI
jgi:peptidoglycan hydrolase CwlO-like protein